MDKKVIVCSQCHKTQRMVQTTIKQFKCCKCLDQKDPFIQQYFNKIAQNKDKPIGTLVKKPRGWKFMKIFVDSQGNVYFRGVLQPQLKNTLPITIIEKKQKKQKISNRQKSENQIQMFAKINSLKNQIIACYQDKDKKKAHRLQKELNQYKHRFKKVLK